MNELTNLIVGNGDILTQKLQEEVSSFLDLHLPECFLNRNDLSVNQIYNELSLHAYALHMVKSAYAKRIMDLYYSLHKGQIPDDPDTVRGLFDDTYLPLSERLIKERFGEVSNSYLNDGFYNQLPTLADYTGIRYLAKFLPSDRLPKIRKPRMGNKRSRIEIEFIKEASDSTIYDRGVLVKRSNRGYSQYCQWEKCKNRTEFTSVYYYEAFNNPLFNPANGCGLYYSKNGQPVSIRIVKLNQQKSKPKLFFVCSKKCYDALLVSLKRKAQLSN